MSYSYHLRKCVVDYVLGGGQKTEAAQLFGVHRQTVQKWIKNYKRDACIAVAEKPGPKSSRKLSETELKHAIYLRPDARLKELAEVFSVHPSTIFYACKKWQITRKKNVGL